MILKRTFRFEAAHSLPNYDGKCRTLHGHGYRLIVFVRLPVDPASGFSMDFMEIKRIIDENVITKIDHKHLNDIIENPTSERLVAWIWDQLEGKLQGLHEIELAETENSSVIYRREE